MKIGLRFKKAIGALIIVSFLAPSTALAVIPAMPVVDVGPQNITAWAGTAASTAASAAELGLLNVAVGVPGAGGLALGAGKAAVDVACKGVEKAEEVASTADTFGNFALIAGSPAEAAKITAKITALVAVKTCREAELTALDKVPTLNLIVGNDLVRRQAILDAEIASLSTRIESLRARQSQSIKEVLKAVALKIVLNLSKNMTTSLVNKMIAKYRVGNFLQYSDAVSSVIYTSDYITKNFSDQQDQLIIRSMLQNGVVQGQVMPLVRAKADDALGFTPENLDAADPNYYLKVAQVGSGQANPYFMQTVFEGASLTAKGQGNEMARQEISQGQGFIPVRDCNGSVTQQAFIDSENVRLSSENNQARQVLEKLKKAEQLNPGSVSEADIQTAAKAVEDSKVAMQALPKTNQPIVQLCENIINPAGFMADSVDTYLSKHLLGEAGNVKADNIPFWATFLSDVATNFVTNIFEGGKPDIRLLTGAGIGVSNLAAADLIQRASNSTENNRLAELSEDIKFEVKQTGPSSATIIWDASKIGDTANPSSYVTIQGAGTSSIEKRQLVGSITVTASISGSYTLRVYGIGSDNKQTELAVLVYDFIYQEPENFYLSGSVPLILGANTSPASPVQLRGP